jgi:threonine/homoserine/homoserine lactone efflux protein
MNLDNIWALIGFAFVNSITPGPNNLMLLASGINYGLRATIPHMLGISLGFGCLLFATGMGLATLFNAYPILHSILKWVGICYFIYLAWKVANAGVPSDKTKITGKPMTITGAAVFQIVNVKAWFMAIGAFSMYTPTGSGTGTILMMTLLFIVINFPSCSSWAVLGSSLRHYLTQDRYRRWFNYTMALLLLACIFPILKH